MNLEPHFTRFHLLLKVYIFTRPTEFMLNTISARTLKLVSAHTAFPCHHLTYDLHQQDIIQLQSVAAYLSDSVLYLRPSSYCTRTYTV